MSAETVVIDVRPGTSDKGMGYARVTADFTMHNTGTVEERMAARFPLGNIDGYEPKEIHDLQVKVNGVPVAMRRIMGEDPVGTPGNIPWAAFDIAFPAGKDVPVRVQYTLEPSGDYPIIWYGYILSTGAGWKDSIGSADIIVQLPYPANIENVIMPGLGGYGNTTPGASFDGNSIRWHYANLEPTTDDNIEVHLVAPWTWQAIQAEEDHVANHPGDGEAWGRLGMYCKQAAFSSRGKGFRAGAMDGGGQRLYERSLQAYQNAVTLLPKDALWHAGYAEALAYHAFFEQFGGIDPVPEALHAMQEIDAALQLAPDDPTVADIAQGISFSFPDSMYKRAPIAGESGFVVAWLTATPTQAQATVVPSTEIAQLVATATSEPALATNTPEVEPTTQATQVPAKPAMPICGSAALIPLALIAFVVVRNDSKTKRKQDCLIQR